MRIAAFLFVICLSFTAQAQADVNKPAPYAGSKSCRECHERFYGLWSTSMHGLAMQPYSETLAKEKLSPRRMTWSSASSATGPRSAQAAAMSWKPEPDGKKKQYRIEYALGGKNVYLLPDPHGQGAPADPAGGL